MKNYQILKQRIDEGIQYIEQQNKKLQPVIDYLTQQCIERKEELPVDKCFEYIIQFMQVKNECLLVDTKMREIVDYCLNNPM